MEKGFLLAAAAKILEADDDESEITLPANSNILFIIILSSYHYSPLRSAGLFFSFYESDPFSHFSVLKTVSVC